ncbi:UDP-glucose/GDP-mannose dehydrogenase family protein [Patescibacteria group bacterium]|nr:UDP-glucose/GDP-mannose dehydrogenase family protein [Patescibacteria group bacterium]
MKITVIGTGYVGLVTTCGLASLGHQVWAVNRTPAKVRKLEKGQILFYEPGLGSLLKKNLKNRKIHFTTNFKEAINKGNFVFICVGTPPLADGRADLSAVKKVAKDITRYAKKPLMIINKSTVPVGTGRLVEKILAKNSHKFNIVSCPEFLSEGKAVKDFFHRDRIVVGADNKLVAQKVMNIFKKIKTVKMITDLETAELIKYSSNAFLATKISFINEIANFCELVGADVDEVAKGMGLDKRIAPYSLKAGIGYGGSCFPKDVKALKQMAAGNGYEFKLLKAVIKVNNLQRRLVIKKTKEILNNVKGKTITVLGLAFKNDTDDIRESAAIDIINWLNKLGAKVKVFDPKASKNAKKVLNSKIIFCSSPKEAAVKSQLLIIATEWSMFKQLKWPVIKKLMKKPNILDGKNLLDRKTLEKYGFNYVAMGK